MPEIRQPNQHEAWSDLPPRFWLLLPLCGVGVGLCSAGLMLLFHGVQHLAWDYQSGEFLIAVEHCSRVHRVLVLACAGAIAGLGALLLQASPGGHGGEITEAIWRRGAQIPLFKTLVRAVISLVVVGMGASLGREGALKQSGAAIGSKLAVLIGLQPHLQRRLTAFSAGAGIAAAYNVPFGGALFAAEILLGSLELSTVVPALIVSVIATIVSRAALPTGPTYVLLPFEIWKPLALWAVPFGLIAGLAAVLYVRVIAWADSIKPKGFGRLWKPLLTLTLLGMLSIRYPQLLGNGKNETQVAFLGRETVSLLGLLPALKLLATAACLGTGVPGGLFTPTILFGALLGGLLGKIWDLVLASAQPGQYSVIGAGAILAATTQAPVSSIILTLELVGRLDFIMIPLLVASAVALTLAASVNQSTLYTSRIQAI